MKKIQLTMLLVISLLLTSTGVYAQNNALNFDGIDDYAEIAGIANPTGSFTTEAWARMETKGWRTIFSKIDNGYYGFTLSYDFTNDKMGAGIGTGTSWAGVQSLTPWNLNQWYHVAMVFDANANTMYYYQDGVLQGSAPAVPSYATTTFFIGNDAWMEVWDGDIDEVRMWNIARTQSEIQSTMNMELTGTEPGLAHYYNFNQGIPGGNNTGITSLTDSQGAANGTFVNFALNGNTSNFVGSFSLTDQTWIDLDGADDFLDFGTDNILAGKTQFTVEMRMHFDYSTGDYTIIGQRNSDVNRTIVLQRWAGDFYLFLSNYNYGYCSFIPCEATIYHLAIVFDGAGATDSDRLKLYINGVLQTLTFSGTIDAVSYVTSPAANLVLGCEHNDPATQLQFVNGQFGEFCVWDYPLTSAEVNSRVNIEVAGTETGLVEYFHFNNGIPGGNNTGITSFAGGKGVSTITPTNMTMSGTASNFVGQPALINLIDTSVTVNNAVITSNAIGAAYQWVDCNNNFAIIPGATSQSYTATTNGSYAVQITQGPCTAISACVQITTLGLNSLQSGSISIYPNPVMNELTIENKTNEEDIYFEILNSLGQIVSSGNMVASTIVQAAGFSPGIYLLKLESEQTIVYRKFVKN